MDLQRAEDLAQGRLAYSGETINSLFQPDALLNEQYLKSFRRGASFEPEKELMLAVLEDAIETLQENRSALSGRKKRLFDETCDWFFTDDPNWIFSFVSVCDALGLNPDYLRKGVSRRRCYSRSTSLN
jgi:hypothetical protein